MVQNWIGLQQIYRIRFDKKIMMKSNLNTWIWFQEREKFHQTKNILNRLCWELWNRDRSICLDFHGTTLIPFVSIYNQDLTCGK